MEEESCCFPQFYTMTLFHSLHADDVEQRESFLVQLFSAASVDIVKYYRFWLFLQFGVNLVLTHLFDKLFI